MGRMNREPAANRSGTVGATPPYLIAKVLPPLGVRQAGDALLVPLTDGNVRVNLQRIEAGR